jgi:hypothetical protein
MTRSLAAPLSRLTPITALAIACTAIQAHAVGPFDVRFSRTSMVV